MNLRRLSAISLVLASGLWQSVSVAQEKALGDWEHLRTQTPQTYVANKVAPKSIEIDGKLEDAAWKSARWTAEFADIEGDKKPKPRFRTQAKMAWDDQYFYIGAQLEEPHVSGNLIDHDAVIFHDNDFEVFIDPNSDNHEYYEFEMNALNTTWDLFLPKPYKDGGSADNGWEIPGIKTAVFIDGTINNPTDTDQGWSVEIAIPWEAMKQYAHSSTPPEAGDQWRVSFSRVEWKYDVVDGKYVKVPNTREDNWVWSPQGLVDMHRPERWGIVQFADSEQESSFVDVPHWKDRDLLLEIYHRQKSFQADNKRYAKDLAELSFDSSRAAGTDLRMELTADGYSASLNSKAQDGTAVRLAVRQDSLLNMEKTAAKVEENVDPLQACLEKAGENRDQIEEALAKVPAEQKKGMEFLVLNMPDRDLKGLTSQYLLDNCKLAYQAWNESKWKDSIPEEVFFNDVLPYANINEGRDGWRQDFYNRFHELVKNETSPGKAAAILNQKIFAELKVRYSTQRAKADQAPSESIKSGLASCTGLSIILIDACRANGIPARFVGTPLWADNSGNHSWVEVWDNGWHFTGAAEPSGDQLDQAWFIGRASTAQRDHRLHAIYAVSYRKTPLTFPLVWDRSIRYVHAVNVTDRYAGKGAAPPEGTIETMIRVFDKKPGNRCAAKIKILAADGQVAFEGEAKDERFDSNDHLIVYLKPADYSVSIEFGDRKKEEKLTPAKDHGVWSWTLE